jgi:hypothetical protein
MAGLSTDAARKARLNQQEVIEQQVIEATIDGCGGLDIVERGGQLEAIRWDGEPPRRNSPFSEARVVNRFICNAEAVEFPNIAHDESNAEGE